MVGLSIILFAWYFTTKYEFVPRFFLPTPFDTLAVLRNGLAGGRLLSDFMATILHMLNGWLLASLLAIAVGSFIGISKTARDYVQPTLEFIRPLPAAAAIPVFIAFLGFSPAMVLGVIVFGSVWPALLSTVHGFAEVDPRLKEVSRTLHMSKWAYIWKIGLPNAVPDIVAGMRLSLTAALILAVVCEMMTAQAGLGNTILMAARSFRSADLFAGILLLGVIGFVSNFGLWIVERRLLNWRHR